MSKDININDEELEALMAELEAQNEEILAAKMPEPTAETCVPDDQKTDEPEVAVVEAEVAEPDEPSPACDSDYDEEGGQTGWSGEKNGDYIAPLPEPKDPSVPRNAESLANPVRVPVDVKEELPFVPDEPHAAAGGEPKRPTEAPGHAGLNYYVDVDQFRADTRVTEASLDQCMIEQNGLRAYYGAQAARAEAQAARIKAKFEVVEATLYDEQRKILAASGEKTTEKMVENAVKMDRRWIKAKNMVIEAETIAAINKGLVQSLADRRDMIIQLGADRRDEYKGAARILAEKQDRDDLRERALRLKQGGAA
jgi:hypothetical protein